MDTGFGRQPKYRFSLIVLSTLALALGASMVRPSTAQGPGPQGWRPPFDEQQVLQLDPQQKAKFTAFENESRDKKKKLISQVRDLRHQLWTAYQSYNLDIKHVKALNRDLNRVQQDLLKLHFDEQVQLRKILTAEQFARLQAAIKEHMPPPNSHWQHGDHGEHGGGPDWH